MEVCIQEIVCDRYNMCKFAIIAERKRKAPKELPRKCSW